VYAKLTTTSSSSDSDSDPEPEPSEDSAEESPDSSLSRYYRRIPEVVDGGQGWKVVGRGKVGGTRVRKGKESDMSSTGLMRAKERRNEKGNYSTDTVRVNGFDATTEGSATSALGLLEFSSGHCRCV